MGYDLTRFVGEIDGEFVCSICVMVLENSMVSPCEHTFCNDCIKGWLEVKGNCPVDSCSLAVDDLKPTPRYFRNLLDKFEIKCNFELQGCQTIVPLKQLEHHLTECVFNPNAEVICDKGCNIKITRGEYEAANCFSHLANRQQEEFNKIISRQEEEISKLNDELSGVRCQVTHSENVIKRQQEEIVKLNEHVSRHQEVNVKVVDESTNVGKATPKWQIRWGAFGKKKRSACRTLFRLKQ